MTTRISGTSGLSVNNLPFGGGSFSGGLLQMGFITNGPVIATSTGQTTPVGIGLHFFDFTPISDSSLILMWADLTLNHGYVHSVGWFKDDVKTVSTTGETNLNEIDMQSTYFVSGLQPEWVNTQRCFHYEDNTSTTSRDYVLKVTCGWNGETNRNITINNRELGDMSCYSSATIMEIG